MMNKRAKTNKKPNVDILPDELMCMILSYVAYNLDEWSVFCICKKWYHIATEVRKQYMKDHQSCWKDISSSLLADVAIYILDKMNEITFVMNAWQIVNYSTAAINHRYTGPWYDIFSITIKNNGLASGENGYSVHSIFATEFSEMCGFNCPCEIYEFMDADILKLEHFSHTRRGSPYTRPDVVEFVKRIIKFMCCTGKSLAIASDRSIEDEPIWKGIQKLQVINDIEKDVTNANTLIERLYLGKIMSIGQSFLKCHTLLNICTESVPNYLTVKSSLNESINLHVMKSKWWYSPMNFCKEILYSVLWNKQG